MDASKLKIAYEGIKEGQKKFSDSIIAINNLIFLSIGYFAGVGPVSVISKLLGKNYLDIEINSKKASYWDELNLKTKLREDYLKQY